jgi:hypothetical protein
MPKSPLNEYNTKQSTMVQKSITAYYSDDPIASLISLHLSRIRDFHVRPRAFTLSEINSLITFAQERLNELYSKGGSGSHCQYWLDTVTDEVEHWKKVDVKKQYFKTGMFMSEFEQLRDKLHGQLPPILELSCWHQPRALHFNFGFENGCLPLIGSQTFHPYSIGARSTNWGQAPKGAWFLLGKFNENLLPYKLNLLILIIAKELHISIGNMLSEGGVYVVYKSNLIIERYKRDDNTNRYYFNIEKNDEQEQYQYYINNFLPFLVK